MGKLFVQMALAATVVCCSSALRAQSILELAAGIKFCRTLSDDAQRLKCYDGIFAEKSAKTDANKPLAAADWNIDQTKSPIDDSPEVSATLMADDAVLVLRCKEHKTEAFFAKQFSFLGSDAIKVLVRIGTGAAIQTTWHPSSNGQAAFAPAPVQFIRALPDNAKLFIRTTGFEGKTADGDFSLGAVSLVREKIAAACRWPEQSMAPAGVKGRAASVAPAR